MHVCRYGALMLLIVWFTSFMAFIVLNWIDHFVSVYYYYHRTRTLVVSCCYLYQQHCHLFLGSSNTSMYMTHCDSKFEVYLYSWKVGSRKRLLRKMEMRCMMWFVYMGGRKLGLSILGMKVFVGVAKTFLDRSSAYS